MQNNVLKYVSFLPTDRLEVNDEIFRIKSKIVAMAVDMADKAIYEACIEAAKEAGVTDLYLVDKRFVADAIKEKLERQDMPPVVHGRWLTSSDIPDTLICSVCDRRYDMYHFDQKDMPYCLCGAKMDAKEE